MDRPKITAEQSKAVQQSNGQPVQLVDEAGTETSLVIVRMDLLQTPAGDPFNIVETYPAQEKALAAVWDDPRLDEYTDQDGSPIE